MKMKKKIIYFLALFFLLAAFGCKSSPDKEKGEEQAVTETSPEPEEVVEEAVIIKVEEESSAPEEKPDEEVPDAVSKAELAKARQALERAETVEASRFAPEIMSQAYKNFKKAKELSSRDPQKSRALLDSVIKDADKGYKLGLAGLSKEYEDKLSDLDKQLIKIKAPQYSPEPYKSVQEQFKITRKALQKGQMEEAGKEFSQSRIKADSLYNSLEENLRWIKILERDTKDYLD